MTTLSVNPPFPIFCGTDGLPLEDGYVWLGQPNLDPQSNPIAVFWDASLTQPAGLPIRTLNGYPSNNGTPARLYVNGNCSIRVVDKKGSLVYSSPSVTDRYNDTVVVIDSSSVMFTQTGTGAVPRTVQNKLSEFVSVTDFGADKTGVLDSTLAIQNALNSGAKRVYAPAGTYKITSTLTMPKDISLEGDGIDITIFDGSSSQYASLTGGKHITNQVATFTQISSLASNVTAGDSVLTFSNSVPLLPNDVILIYNPTNYSYSHARPYYRAGEYARVAVSSGATTTIQGTLAASYASSAVNVYKLENTGRCKLSGFTLKGLNSTSNVTYGIFLNTCVDSLVENVRVHNCSYTSLLVDRCFNMQIVGCSVQEDMVSSFAGDYGLTISSSQNVNVSGGYFCAGRHSISTGSFDGIGYVPGRYIYVNNATITTSYNPSADAPAMDFHENTEYSNVVGCTMNGGISVGGNHINIVDNFIEYGSGSTPTPFYCTSLSGANLSVIGNTIISKTNTANSDTGLLMQLVLVDDRVETGGTISIKNNKFIWDGSSVTSRNAINIYTNKKATSGISVNLEICDNSISSSSQLDYAIGISKGDDTSITFKNISIRNNVSTCGGISVRTSVLNPLTNTRMAENISVQNNDVSNGKQHGIICWYVKNNAVVTGNRISNFLSFPIGVSNNGVGAKMEMAEISGNDCVNCLATPSGSGATDCSSAYLAYAQSGVVRDNFGLSNKKYITLTPAAVTGTFVVGDVITQAPSGITATVEMVNGNNLGIGTSASGSFVAGAGQTLTGSISGATCTNIATSNTFAVGCSIGVEFLDSAYVARNVDGRNLDPVRNTITGYLKGSEWDIVKIQIPSTTVTANSSNTFTLNTTNGVIAGDMVLPTFNQNLNGLILTGSVSTLTPNVPSVRFSNPTNANITFVIGDVQGKIIKV